MSPAACELAPGILGSVRKLRATERELLATLPMSDAEWHAGPLVPAGYTAHLLASHGERVFLFCLTQVPGSDFPE